MKGALMLELFGDDTRQMSKFYSNMVNDALGHKIGSQVFGNMPSSCWVAEITGVHKKYKYDREFIHGKKDYSHSNSVGSRGIYSCFILESGKYYEVKEQTSWRNSDRYFVKVNSNGDITRVEEEEIQQWLKVQ